MKNMKKEPYITPAAESLQLAISGALLDIVASVPGATIGGSEEDDWDS